MAGRVQMICPHSPSTLHEKKKADKIKRFGPTLKQVVQLIYRDKHGLHIVSPALFRHSLEIAEGKFRKFCTAEDVICKDIVTTFKRADCDGLQNILHVNTDNTSVSTQAENTFFPLKLRGTSDTIHINHTLSGQKCLFSRQLPPM